ncbi:hypothetical protein C8Q80DRAFT_544580 [Daedaleopsis nitida]|nr:hypothetical protein C8Q80DRAFT_544580 [Daedaleopsis nitida]
MYILTEFTSAEASYDRPDPATAGPILVQGFLHYLCQGVIITQAKKFYDRWEDDSVALRVYVFALLCFSLLQTILESYKVWVVVIDGLHWWTNRLHFTEFLCNALICSLCELFLVRRCYKMTGRRTWVLACLGGLSFTTIAASIFLTVKIALVIGPIASDPIHIDPLHASIFAYPLWVYGTLAMALSLTTLLSRALWRTKTGLPYLDRTLAHIIAITWETAALPAACMLASAIIYSVRGAAKSINPADADSLADVVHRVSAFQETNLDLFFAILTGKVYTLGLLRTLNSRTQFRARLDSSYIGRRSLSGYQWADADAEAAEAGEDGSVADFRRHVAIDPLDNGVSRDAYAGDLESAGEKDPAAEGNNYTSVDSSDGSDSSTSAANSRVRVEMSPRTAARKESNVKRRGATLGVQDPIDNPFADTRQDAPMLRKSVSVNSYLGRDYIRLRE